MHGHCTKGRSGFRQSSASNSIMLLWHWFWMSVGVILFLRFLVPNSVMVYHHMPVTHILMILLLFSVPGLGLLSTNLTNRNYFFIT